MPKNTNEKTEAGNPRSQPKLITDITTSKDAGSFTITISANRLLEYTSVNQPLPLGLVMYFPETSLGIAKTEYNAESSVVGKIKAAELIENGPSKIIIGLKKEAPYKISRDGNDLKIVFVEPEAVEAEPAPGSEEEVKEENLNQEKGEVLAQSPEQPPAPVPPAAVQEAAAETPAPITAQPEKNTLKAITTENVDGGLSINVQSDTAINNVKAFALKNPPRIVFDLYDLKSPFKKQQVVKIGSEIADSVRDFAYPDKVRVVVDTKDQYLASFSSEPKDHGLVIRIGQATNQVSTPEAASTEEPAQETGGQAEVPAPLVAAPAAEAVPMATKEAAVTTEASGKEEVAGQPAQQQAVEQPPEEETTPPTEPSLVNRIDFISKEKGASSVIVGTTRPVEYNLAKINDKKLKLELFDTKILSYRQRPLVTTRFESAVDRITPIQTPEMKKSSELIIELREAVAYEVNKEGDQIKIDFQPSTVAPKPLEAVDLPPWKKILEEAAAEKAQVPPPQPEEGKQAAEEVSAPVEEAAPEVVETKPEEGPVPVEVAAESEQPLTAENEQTPTFQEKKEATVKTTAEKSPAVSGKRFTGEKIALDFYQTDIKNVLRILRDVSGKNFAIDKDVKGKVTLTLVKPVPWDQVLDLILRMNRLGQITEGDIVRIVTFKTLKAEQKRVSEALKAERNLQKQKKAIEPLITEYIPINYASASGDIKPRLNEIKTPKRGQVGVDARNNQIIMTDTKEKIAQAKAIIRIVDKVTPQVVIEARIVEVSETFSRDIGTEWGMTGARTAASAVGTSTTSDWSIAMNHLPSSGGDSLGYNFSRIVGTPFSLNATLQAIEAEGKGKIVSAPKIVTLDNKAATIKQGLEYPYLERDSSGLATVKFKSIDLQLKVTPHVTPDDRISLKMDITKNDIESVTNGVPSLSTNQATTELLVNDNDTIVIGGIIKKTATNSESRFPLLSRIPILGWLFKSKQVSNKKNELLIFMSPKIVHLEK